MSYVENNLLPGEEIISKAQVHWSIFMWPAIWTGAAAYYFINASYANKYAAWGSACAVLALLMIARAATYYLTTELAVTNKRVIAKIGMVQRKTVELMHSKVESLNFDQSVLGRILNYGTINVNGTGGKSAPVKRISAPISFRRTALELIDKSDN